MITKLYKYLKDKNTLINHKCLNPIKNHLNNPKLWNINEYSTTRAFAIGTFSALLPIPCQMLLSSILAIYLEAHIALSILLVWITNPITMPFIFYLQYKVGLYFFPSNVSPELAEWSYSWYWLTMPYLSIMKTFLLGVLITSVSGALLSYILCSSIWKTYYYFSQKKERDD